jgi:hypothetical protein
MNKVTFSLILFLLFIFLQTSNAQKFQGGAFLGFNASQIDGDQLAGYNKIGLNTGLNISYDLNEPWQLNIDFGYSQKGSRTGLSVQDGDLIRKITLNYIELPIYVSYQDWWIEDVDYFKIQAYTGISIGRLISVKNQLGDSDYDQENFLKNDLGLLVGAKFFFNNNWGINGRYTRSIVRMYKNPSDNSKSLLGYFLNFGLVYKIL